MDEKIYDDPENWSDMTIAEYARRLAERIKNIPKTEGEKTVGELKREVRKKKKNRPPKAEDGMTIRDHKRAKRKE